MIRAWPNTPPAKTERSERKEKKYSNDDVHVVITYSSIVRFRRQHNNDLGHRSLVNSFSSLKLHGYDKIILSGMLTTFAKGHFVGNKVSLRRMAISPTHIFLDQWGHLVYLFNVVIYSSISRPFSPEVIHYVLTQLPLA